MWHWTVDRKSIRNGDHCGSNNCLIPLLIIAFPSYLYKLLMLSRNLCSCRAMILSYWSTPMVTVCSFSCYEFNTPLRMTHWCSNSSMDRIFLLNLVGGIGLAHWEARSVQLLVWKHIYSFPDGGSFNDVVWFEELYIHWCGLGLSWTWEVGVFAPLNSVPLWLCFIGVA